MWSVLMSQGGPGCSQFMLNWRPHWGEKHSSSCVDEWRDRAVKWVVRCKVGTYCKIKQHILNVDVTISCSKLNQNCSKLNSKTVNTVDNDAWEFASTSSLTKVWSDDPDVIWTRSLLIWSQTRYRCATESTDIRFHRDLNSDRWIQSPEC